MSGIIYYWIAAIGICFIFKYGTILQKFREITISKFFALQQLYNCCLCMGFWAGVILSPILFLKQNLTTELIVFPFTTACISWFADNIISVLIQLQNLIENAKQVQQHTLMQPTPQQISKLENHPLRSVPFNSTSKGMMPNV
jgi:hypothetical protein